MVIVLLLQKTIQSWEFFYGIENFKEEVFTKAIKWISKNCTYPFTLMKISQRLFNIVQFWYKFNQYHPFIYSIIKIYEAHPFVKNGLRIYKVLS